MRTWSSRDASNWSSDGGPRGQNISRISPPEGGFSPLPLQAEPLLSSRRDPREQGGGKVRRKGNPVTCIRGIEAGLLGLARIELGLQRELPEQLHSIR